MMRLLWWLSNKESACNAGNVGPILGSRRSPGEGNGNPLQYSCLENSSAVEPGGLQSMELQKLDVTQRLNHHRFHHTSSVLSERTQKAQLTTAPFSSLLQPHWPLGSFCALAVPSTWNLLPLNILTPSSPPHLCSALTFSH